MISETITTNPSSTSTPDGDVSLAIVKITGGGYVKLQVKDPQGHWTDIASKSGAYGVHTPVSSLEYRFVPVQLTGSASVFFGG